MIGTSLWDSILCVNFENSIKSFIHVLKILDPPKKIFKNFYLVPTYCDILQIVSTHTENCRGVVWVYPIVPWE